MDDQATRLKALVNKNNLSAPVTPKGIRVIAVTSGKGGVGKTNVSINLAIALAELGQRVIVFDGDLGLANVDVICGLNPSYTLEDVVNGFKSLSEVLIDGPAGIRILPGGSGGSLVNIMPSELAALLEKLQMLEEMADILLIDTGAGIAKNVTQLLEAADEVIVVATPEPTSLTDAYGLVKTLLFKGKDCRIGVLINRVRSKDEAETTFSRLAAAMDRFLKYKANYLGFIYEDHFVTKAVMRQTPVTAAFLSAPATQCIKLIAKNLVGVLAKSSYPARGIRGLMEGLLAQLSNRR